MNGVLTIGRHVAQRGKQTILEPVTDDENIEFPTGSMVIKGEYLTLAAQQKRKGGYAYQDYRPGAIVYRICDINML